MAILYEAPIFLGLFFIVIAKFDFLPKPYVDSKWMAVYLASLLSTSILLLNSKSILLPKFSRKTGAFVYSLGFLAITNYFYHEIHPWSIKTLDRLCLLALTLYSYNFFTKFSISWRSKVFFLLGLTFSLILWLAEFMNAEISSQFKDVSVYSSTFGNMNMFAQFCVLSLVLLGYIVTSSSHHFIKIWASIMMAWSLVAIYFSYTRSVYVSTAILILLSTTKLRFFSKKLLLFFLFPAIVACLYILPKVQISPLDFLESKTHSTNLRKEVLLETIDLIKENPFGAGLGSYEFGYIPYEMKGFYKPGEKTIYRSPHNEFLRFIAEDGLVFSILLLFLFIAFLCKSMQALPARGKDRFFIICFIAVFSIEMLFQFPFENPFPFFIATIFLGYLLKLSCKSYEAKQAYPTIFLTILISLQLSLFFGWTISTFFENTKESSKSHLACQAINDNWRACSNHIRNQMNEGNLEGARLTVLAELKKKNFNFTALQFLPIIYYSKGNLDLACEASRFYSSIFFGNSNIYAFHQKNCPELKLLEGEEFLIEYREFLIKSSTNKR